MRGGSEKSESFVRARKIRKSRVRTEAKRKTARSTA
jgi:hypothetical protein